MSRVMKLAKKELTNLGCEVIGEDSRSIIFLLRDGKRWTCSSRTLEPVVRSVIRTQRGMDRVLSGEYLRAFPVTHSAPVLEVHDFDASPHFKDRLALMRGQGLRFPDVVAAILTPDEVRLSPTGRWLYCRGDIAVVVGKPVADKYPLISVIWATDELWEQNPRPETEGL